MVTVRLSDAGSPVPVIVTRVPPYTLPEVGTTVVIWRWVRVISCSCQLRAYLLNRSLFINMSELRKISKQLKVIISLFAHQK